MANTPAGEAGLASDTGPAAGAGAVPASTGSAGVAHTSENSGTSSATGRVSAGLTGLSTDSAGGGAVSGAITETSSLGNAQSTKGGADLNLGQGASGGLGLHGDQEARLRAGVSGPTGGVTGSTMPQGTLSADPAAGPRGGLGGGLGGPSGAGAAMKTASGADGHEAQSGLLGTTALRDPGTDTDAPATAPEKQDGSTSAAMGGSAIDRANTGQGGDVGGSITGPG